MCRMLGYVGAPVLLDELLIGPDNSLIHQTVNARMLAMLNLAGFGLAAWNDGLANPALPLTFHSTNVAVFDSNLRTLAAKLPVRTLVAHLRGVPLDGTAVVNQQSLHPFHLPGCPLVLAHNGDLAEFGRMRTVLLGHIHPDIARRMTALTDSAFLHALVLSQLADTAGPFTADGILAAVVAALRIVRQERAKLGITKSSSTNLIVTDGRHLVAVRFTFDFGRFAEPPFQGGVEFLSLWYTLGAAYGLHDGEWKMVGEGGADTLVASEPLTRDVSTWVEVPEYHALVVDAAPAPGVRRRRIIAVDA
jgi:glutamine amidotransferase